MRQTFSASYQLARGAGPDRRQEYVNFRHANYVATYQKRAAVSLGDVGRPQKWVWFWNGWRAKKALDDAIADSAARGYRPDVMRVIRSVRSSFDAPPFRGKVTPSTVSFGEVLTLVAAAGEPFDGDEKAEIDGGIFPVSQVPVFRSGDTLRTFAVADVGPQVLRVTNVGTSIDTQLADLLIGSLLDPGDKALMACGPTDTACVRSRAPSMLVRPGSPFIAFLALSRKGPGPPDSVDLFQIAGPPGAPLSLTAELDWRGSGDLDLLWRDCATFAFTPNVTGATMTKPERTTEVIPPGRCRMLQVTMRPTDPGPAFARLHVKTP